jgi:2-methylcitrate dehydratase PrpD
MEITGRIADYVVSTQLEDFPPDGIQAAKGAIMDCLGCALAGSREPLADILSEFVQANGGGTSASVIGRGFKTSAADAAQVNGAISHALDYDDITRALKGHPTAVLMPPALALAESQGATGLEMLMAYMLGFEVACSIGEAMSPEYYDELGWHPTGPVGALGAAVAASRILKLDRDQTAMAISLAASQAAGLRQNFGTMTKPYHAGAACRTGVTAAQLVSAGFTASLDAIEGRFGFLHAFSGGGGYEADRILENLGKTCYLVESGIEIKKYPCCGSAHLALDATARILDRSPLNAADIEKIDVVVDFDPPRSLIHDRPQSALEGKFSMQYCLAAAVLDGKVGMDAFTDQQVLRPEAQDLIPKVTMRRLTDFQGQPSWVEAYNQVAVHLKDGTVLTERVDRINEGALRGVTMDEIIDKFRDCASTALTADDIEELVTGLSELEQLPDVRRVADLLRG